MFLDPLPRRKFCDAYFVLFLMEHRPQTERELVAAVQAVWANIPQTAISRYVESFPSRLKKVIESKGQL